MFIYKYIRLTFVRINNAKECFSFSEIVTRIVYIRQKATLAVSTTPERFVTIRNRVINANGTRRVGSDSVACLRAATDRINNWTRFTRMDEGKRRTISRYYGVGARRCRFDSSRWLYRKKVTFARVLLLFIVAVDNSFYVVSERARNVLQGTVFCLLYVRAVVVFCSPVNQSWLGNEWSERRAATGEKTKRKGYETLETVGS